MRRLNKVPLYVFLGGVCLVVGAIGYTCRDRLKSSAAATQSNTTKAEGANGAAVLNGAPRSGEIQSAAFHPFVPAQSTPAPPSVPVETPPVPMDTGRQQQPPEDPALEARRQAWQNYYQQLAALQQQRQQDAASALKADTAPSGMAGGGGGAGVPQPSGGTDAQQLAQAQGTGTQSGTPVSAGGGFGLGFGGGYPILPPAGPDPSGAREKQSFVGQAGKPRAR